MSPKIKICGVCDPLEARRIEELGADYVGMIFYSRSLRFVDIGKAKKIAGAMSGRAKRVGVFVSESPDFIKTAAAECGLAAIQLHGGQSADFAEEIAETGCEIWRAVWLDSEAALAEAEAFPCAALIADSRSKVAVGGTGELSDWARDIVEGLGSYAEVSPSGKGVHVIAWADPEQVGAVGRNNRRDGIEIYNHGRYFTVTGERVAGDGIANITDNVAGFISRWFRGESPEEAVRRRVGDLASAQVKRMANRTMTRNAARDGVRYARVPTGAETCGWCLMLASRSFVYASEASAGGDRPDHYHNDCDCKIVPEFEATEVEGYDPDALYDVYSEAYGDLDGRAGLRRMWEELPEENRARRIDRRDGDEGAAFDAYCEEQIAKRIELKLTGSTEDAT